MSEDSTNIFQNLLDQIHVYALSETHPDTFNSLRLEKEAKRLGLPYYEFETLEEMKIFFENYE